MNVEQRIRNIYDKWFLAEPALHAVLCCHDVHPNNNISCIVRSGKGMIEYNAQLLSEQTEQATEELLRAEAIRLILKHPYQRQPINCPADILTIASNITISNSYTLPHINIDKAADNNLPPDEYFEYYANKLMEQRNDSYNADNEQNKTKNKQPKQNSQSYQQQQAKAAQSELWDEDESQQYNINRLIEQTTHWGTLPQNLIDEIKASAQARANFRHILQGFRASVISTRRALTRMRPNRRTGFQNMGSIYHFSTHLLVAIDVSGSISDASVGNFLSATNRLFKYGINAIDLVQFDCQMSTPISMRKAKQSIKVNGRGGTNFQPLFDYIATHTEYDGLIILTDGYAPQPTIPPLMRTKILWVCDNANCYKTNHIWMENIGRCCYFE